MNAAMVDLGIRQLDEFAICPESGCKSVSMGVFEIRGERTIAPCREHALERRRDETGRVAEAARAALEDRWYPDLEPELVGFWLAQLMEHFNKQWTKEYRTTWIRGVSGRLSASQFQAACERAIAEDHDGPRYFPSADKIVRMGRTLVPEPPAHERLIGGGRQQLLLAAGG